jgi:hypothetical protein
VRCKEQGGFYRTWQKVPVEVLKIADFFLGISSKNLAAIVDQPIR